MTHHNAPLTVEGRRRLVALVIDEGQSTNSTNTGGRIRSLSSSSILNRRRQSPIAITTRPYPLETAEDGQHLPGFIDGCVTDDAWSD
jgi:hypothetical protein